MELREVVTLVAEVVAEHRQTQPVTSDQVADARVDDVVGFLEGIRRVLREVVIAGVVVVVARHFELATRHFKRSEEHTYELQSLMRNSYAVFCLKKKTNRHH